MIQPLPFKKNLWRLIGLLLLPLFLNAQNIQISGVVLDDETALRYPASQSI